MRGSPEPLIRRYPGWNFSKALPPSLLPSIRTFLMSNLCSSLVGACPFLFMHIGNPIFTMI
jgi:hypothetical protein